MLERVLLVLAGVGIALVAVAVALHLSDDDPATPTTTTVRQIASCSDLRKPYDDITRLIAEAHLHGDDARAQALQPALDEALAAFDGTDCPRPGG